MQVDTKKKWEQGMKEEVDVLIPKYVKIWVKYFSIPPVVSFSD
jgi:hypothetical protein